ncbi:hypothetical protein FM036_39480 [Nostoc sp. HG1]|nr:hypothetical protein [Nostoc sp. HG1]
MNDLGGLCTCGCQELAPLAKRSNESKGVVRGQPLKYIQGHGSKGKKTSAESNLKRSQTLSGRVLTDLHKTRIGTANKGKQKTPEAIANHIRSLTGREPTYSPYVEGLVVKFDQLKSRWYCCDPQNKRKTTTHARAVYEHVLGVVAKGFHVHHKDSKFSSLEDDRPENLMLLSAKWNFDYLPRLSEGFGVTESRVTTAYIQAAVYTPEEKMFREVCKLLVKETASDF